MKRIVLVLICVFVLGFVGCAASEGGADTNAVSGGGAASGESSGQTLGKFTAEGLDGEAVDESILSGKKVTMLNLWAPWCGPCVGEMPDLAALNEKYADKGFQVIGVIDEKDLDGADKVIKDTGANYKMVLLGDVSSELYKFIIGNNSFINAIPFTVFVDENGNQLGEGYSGAMDWEPIIKELLGE